MLIFKSTNTGFGAISLEIWACTCSGYHIWVLSCKNDLPDGWLSGWVVDNSSSCYEELTPFCNDIFQSNSLPCLSNVLKTLQQSKVTFWLNEDQALLFYFLHKVEGLSQLTWSLSLLILNSSGNLNLGWQWSV